MNEAPRSSPKPPRPRTNRSTCCNRHLCRCDWFGGEGGVRGRTTRDLAFYRRPDWLTSWISLNPTRQRGNSRGFPRSRVFALFSPVCRNAAGLPRGSLRFSLHNDARKKPPGGRIFAFSCVVKSVKLRRASLRHPKVRNFKRHEPGEFHLLDESPEHLGQRMKLPPAPAWGLSKSKSCDLFQVEGVNSHQLPLRTSK